MNTRTGQFQRVAENPLSTMHLNTSQFLCYPARVGPLVIYIYFHQQFLDLGCSLANLFDLATDEQITAGPDAVYVYGAPPESLAPYGDLPTVFYDDESEGLLVAAVPLENRFGYFGYLKKMVLTLHNIVMMKRGRMPYHGAMVRIVLSAQDWASPATKPRGPRKLPRSCSASLPRPTHRKDIMRSSISPFWEPYQ
ncbi:MAG: hypothetical protein WCJ35_01440 [Planctomycetota bacterium]